MLLDETLRQKIDIVLRRRQAAEWISSTIQGSLEALFAFCLVRAGAGLLSGGRGSLVAIAVAAAVGITRTILLRRIRHTRLGAARFIDAQLGLADRLATTVELSGPGRPRSPVEQWLFADAARQAHSIHPRELVPYTLPRQARWFPVLLVLGVIVSLPIYPTELPWQAGTNINAKARERADELQALVDQLSALQEPEMKRVAEELQRVADNLRNSSLPQDQARQILEELEQELQPASSPTSAQQLGLSTAQVQELAHRLRNMESSSGLPPGDRISRNAISSAQAGIDRTEGQDGRGQQGDDGDGQTGRGQSENSNADNSEGRSLSHEPEGIESENEGSLGDKNQGSFGAGSHDDLPFDESLGDGFSDSEGASSAAEGSLDQHGSSAGSGGGVASEDPYQRQLDPETVTQLTGELAEGVVRTAQAQGNSPPGENGSKSDGSSSTVFATGEESAVDQENIPAAYRRWVQLYFEALDPKL